MVNWTDISWSLCVRFITETRASQWMTERRFYSLDAVPMLLFSVAVNKYGFYPHYRLSLQINDTNYRNLCSCYWYIYIYIYIYIAGSHIKITMQITSLLFWYFARRRLLVTDVSVQHIGPVFFTSKASTLKMEPLGCPETSVTNYRCTLRNVPQEGRSRLHLGGSVRSPSR